MSGSFKKIFCNCSVLSCFSYFHRIFGFLWSAEKNHQLIQLSQQTPNPDYFRELSVFHSSCSGTAAASHQFSMLCSTQSDFPAGSVNPFWTIQHRDWGVFPFPVTQLKFSEGFISSSHRDFLCSGIAMEALLGDSELPRDAVKLCPY